MATGGPPPRRYRVEFAPIAAKARDALPAAARRRVIAKATALADDPRPVGVRKLTGHQATDRVRVGDDRIIYEIHDDILRVLVVRIGPRGDVDRP